MNEPAAVGIGVDGLAVGEHDDREEQRDRTGDRDVKRNAGRAREQQDVEDLVRPVRHRRQCVETEGADGSGFGQALVLLRGTGQRPSEEGATQYSHPGGLSHGLAPPHLRRELRRRVMTGAPGT